MAYSLAIPNSFGLSGYISLTGRESHAVYSYILTHVHYLSNAGRGVLFMFVSTVTENLVRLQYATCAVSCIVHSRDTRMLHP